MKALAPAVARAALLAGALASLLPATTFSFTGAFTQGDQVQYFDLTVSGQTTIYTLSYGGGTNAAGAAIPAGGFDPLLTLFAADGTQVGSFDNSAAGGGGCLGPVALGTDGCLDAYFNDSLNPGDYVLALSQFTTTPNGNLSDGFTWDPAICATQFCDTFDNTTPLTGNWAVDIVGADSAAPASAPEPATSMLSGAAILLFIRKTARLFKSDRS